MKPSDFFLEVQKLYMDTIDKHIESEIESIDRKIRQAAAKGYSATDTPMSIDYGDKNFLKAVKKHYKTQGFKVSQAYALAQCIGLKISWRKKYVYEECKGKYFRRITKS